MNERIEAIRRAASQITDDEVAHFERVHNRRYLIGDWSEIFSEKFAELLVKECARTAANFSIENKRIHPDIDPCDMPDANRMVYHATCQCVADEIKTHFGVEE